jgi:hypothetical protein
LDFVTVFLLQSKTMSLQFSPNLEDEVPVFTFPIDREAQLYPQTPAFLSIAFIAGLW